MEDKDQFIGHSPYQVVADDQGGRFKNAYQKRVWALKSKSS